MSYTSKIRERLIRLLWDGPQLRRTIENQFGKSRRRTAQEELSLLISEGAILSTGSGRRGHPNQIQLSPIYPFDKHCPLCGQTITPKGEQWDSRDLSAT
jgi:hypothetical protein